MTAPYLDGIVRCRHRRAHGVALLVMALMLCGCVVTPPRAWEKDLLALPAMAMPADPVENRTLSHVYGSKENAFGGGDIGGGGCGCN